jgi:nuclear pore complex protein Nup62
MLATDLHTNLDDLSSSLTQMIDAVNALSTTQKPATEGADDPMAQISQVLSSHLESLQWIDTATRELDTKVGEVERRVKESGHTVGSGQKGRGGFGLNR